MKGTSAGIYSFDFRQALQAQQRAFFTVGHNGAYSFDTTGLSLTIAAVPAPATWAMMLLGISGWERRCGTPNGAPPWLPRRSFKALAAGLKSGIKNAADHFCRRRHVPWVASSDQAVSTCPWRRERSTAPAPKKPMISMAQVAGSGTTPGEPKKVTCEMSLSLPLLFVIRVL